MSKWLKNTFTFKAIETRYDGYLFRSRLEARWATFFNTLGIPYEYEKEPFDLDGIHYLPDFWMSQQDSWVEIKGEVPTEEEREKARRLALYTQKNVATFYGNIELPNLRDLHSFNDQPAELCTYPSPNLLGERFTERIEAPSHILALLQEAEKNRLLLYARSDGDVVVAPAKRHTYTIGDIDDLLDDLQQQYQMVLRFKGILQEREEELQSFLTPKPGWDVLFLSQAPEGAEDQAYWAECNRCGAIQIANGFITFHHCKDGTEGRLIHDTPRLVTAYKAARSARFEWWRR